MRSGRIGGSAEVGDRAVEPPGPEQSLDLETRRLHGDIFAFFSLRNKSRTNRMPG